MRAERGRAQHHLLGQVQIADHVDVPGAGPDQWHRDALATLVRADQLTAAGGRHGDVGERGERAAIAVAAAEVVGGADRQGVEQDSALAARQLTQTGDRRLVERLHRVEADHGVEHHGARLVVGAAVAPGARVQTQRDRGRQRRQRPDLGQPVGADHRRGELIMGEIAAELGLEAVRRLGQPQRVEAVGQFADRAVHLGRGEHRRVDALGGQPVGDAAGGDDHRAQRAGRAAAALVHRRRVGDRIEAEHQPAGAVRDRGQRPEDPVVEVRGGAGAGGARAGGDDVDAHQFDIELVQAARYLGERQQLVGAERAAAQQGQRVRRRVDPQHGQQQVAVPAHAAAAALGQRHVEGGRPIQGVGASTQPTPEPVADAHRGWPPPDRDQPDQQHGRRATARPVDRVARRQDDPGHDRREHSDRNARTQGIHPEQPEFRITQGVVGIVAAGLPGVHTVVQNRCPCLAYVESW